MAKKQEIECYAHFSDESDYSDSWATSLLNIWIEAKKLVVSEALAGEEFKDFVINEIIEASDWRTEFEEAACRAGYNLQKDGATIEKLYDIYLEENRSKAMNLIPIRLHTEFRWVPEWVEFGLDELIDSHGIKSSSGYDTSIGSIIPGEWLARFLRLVNVSSEEMVAAGLAHRSPDGFAFAEKVKSTGFSVLSDEGKPSLMTGLNVIEILENAYSNAIPVVHAQIELRSLFDLDPTKDMVLTTDERGEVSIGFHCFVNGAGYMDSYKGSIVVPAAETGFTGSDRWSYGINKTYDLVLSYFNTAPKNA